MPELLPLVHRARVHAPDNPALRSLELRTYAALTKAIRSRPPRSAGPPRRRTAMRRTENGVSRWSITACGTTRDGLLTGRKRLVARGLWRSSWPSSSSARGIGRRRRANGRARWGAHRMGRPTRRPSCRRVLCHSTTASCACSPVPMLVLRPADRRELLLTWGQPAQAWSVFEPTLQRQRCAGFVAAVRRSCRDADDARGASRARPRADALGGSRSLAARGPCARADAVRELLEGGDRVAARGVLERLATDSTAPTEAHSVAQSALLQVLIADGGAAARRCEKQVADPKSRLSADDRAALRLALARARIAAASSIARRQRSAMTRASRAVAQRGWIACIAAISRTRWNRSASPDHMRTDRAAATDRTTMLALLQRIQQESSPELGAALLTLARGDSTSAIAGLRRAAGRCPSKRPAGSPAARRTSRRPSGR